MVTDLQKRFPRSRKKFSVTYRWILDLAGDRVASIEDKGSAYDLTWVDKNGAFFPFDIDKKEHILTPMWLMHGTTLTRAWGGDTHCGRGNIRQEVLELIHRELDAPIDSLELPEELIELPTPKWAKRVPMLLTASEAVELSQDFRTELAALAVSA